MDDLLREFLTETGESLDTVDNQLVKFEQEPNNAKILDNIFRLVHTIKGTCGFLGLPRLEALAHAGETLMGKFRDGMPVTGQAVTVILSSIDRIKEILAGLEATEAEPEGTDRDLIEKLEAMVEHGMAAMSAGVAAAPVAEAPPLVPEAPVAVEAAPTSGALADQTLERPLRLGEVSLDELERAFRETAIEAPAPAPVAKAEPAAEAPAPVAKEAAKETAKDAKDAKAKPAPKKSAADETASEGDRIANQSIRVNVDTLEHLMTMVSELVLTRNQLLEISRRNEDTEFKVPLQRLSNVTAELQEGVMKTRMQPIGNAWQKLPRIVRDLSGELGKQIELEMHGADTELDRQVLDLIKDPLTHMVRNSADHGLETPGRASRRRQGRAGHHPPVRLSRGRPHHHLHRRQRPRPQHRQDQGQGDLLGSGHRGRAREDERSPDPQVHLRPGLLDRGRHHLGVGPRRRHGRGAHQYRPDRRHHRHQVGGRRGLLRHHQDPADLGHRLRADRGGRRRPFCDPAARRGRTGPCPRQLRAPHRAHQGHLRSSGCATSCCR
ncbi:chemotaxis protein histidine kinase CheA [Bradyrhizobium sp. LM3.2]